MSLPEVGLGPLTAEDHEQHHVTIHDILNRLQVDSTTPGDMLMKTAAGTGANTVGTAQPQYHWPNQVQAVTHSVAGALAIAAARDTRAIKVTASANITSMTVGGLELVGDGFSQVWVRIEATAAITLALTSASFEIVGTAPTALANGEAVQFLVQRWNT